MMYMGRIVETAPTADIIEQPIHPYTRTLMAARPKPDPKIRIKAGIEIGEPPSQFNRPPGCPYARRCRWRQRYARRMILLCVASRQAGWWPVIMFDAMKA